MKKAEQDIKDKLEMEEEAAEIHREKKREKQQRQREREMEMEQRQAEKRRAKEERMAMVEVEETLERRKSVDMLPDGLLDVLGSLGELEDDDYPEEMEQEEVVQVQPKKGRKKQNKKLKEMWKTAGVDVKSSKDTNAVKVQLPSDMVKFLENVEAEVPRGKVIKKTRRKKQ